jgi:hypothetical protein
MKPAKGCQTNGQVAAAAAMRWQQLTWGMGAQARRLGARRPSKRWLTRSANRARW